MKADDGVTPVVGTMLLLAVCLGAIGTILSITNSIPDIAGIEQIAQMINNSMEGLLQ